MVKTITNPYALTALACTGGLLFGFDISSMSAIIGTENYKVYFSNTGVTPDGNGGFQSQGPDANLQGGITASMAGGSFIGAILSGFISDRLGRRQAIAVACIVWIIGSILACSTTTVAQLIIGRVVCGLCVGIASAQVPVYVSELAPANLRGRLVGCQQWAITWGIAVMYYISYGCSFIKPNNGTGTASFRVPWGIQMLPAILLLCIVPFMPRSPRWLASKGRWEECLAVLALVHGKGDKNAPLVIAEYKEIQLTLAEESQSKWSDLLKGNNANRLHIAMFTQIWSQLTGMNVMMYYISFIFSMCGLTGNANLLSGSIQYVIFVVMTVPALIWLDKWGRRPTLIVGSTFMATWLFAVAGIMASYGTRHYPGPNESASVTWNVGGAAGKGVIACTYLFVASYAPTWGPVSWVYPPELFPTRLRGKSNSISTASNWIFNFALSYFVPPGFENIQWKLYLVFGCFCTAMTIHVFLAFPETAGITLEEVESIFAAGTPAWRTSTRGNRNKLEAVAAAVVRGEDVEEVAATNLGKSGATAESEKKDVESLPAYAADRSP